MSALWQFLLDHHPLLSQHLPRPPHMLTELMDPTSPPRNRGGGGTVPPDGGGEVEVPDAPPSPPENMVEPIKLLISWAKWGVLVCGMAGLLICAAKMTIGQRNRASLAADGASGIPWVLGGLSLASVSASIVQIVYGAS